MKKILLLLGILVVILIAVLVNKPQDEQTTLTKQMEQVFKTKYVAEASKIEIRVTKMVGNYAKGEISTGAGGGIWFAARRNNEWLLVWDGNGIIQCSELSAYTDFPNTLIPQCFDKTTDELIVR